MIFLCWINFDMADGLYYSVLESTASWLPIESNIIQPEYYFPPNTEPNSNYYLDNYFKNSIE